MSDKAKSVLASVLAYGLVFVVFYIKTRNLSLSQYKQYISDWYANETEPDKIFLELMELILEQKEKNER
jgi:hypothetical protein